MTRPQYKSPSWALQKAQYSRLISHSAMTSYKSLVFDFVKENQAYPYIKIGQDYSDEWGARDIAGMEFTTLTDIFAISTATVVGKKECKAICKAVIIALSDGKLDLSSDNFSVAVQLFAGYRVLEEDGKTGIIYHGIVEFNYKIQSI